MESSKPYQDGMKTKEKKVSFELLKKLSANGIILKPSLLKLYKKLSVFLTILFVCNFANAQTGLKSFSANFISQKVNLFWETSTENNSNYFSVERSWNGKDFETIGLVKASVKSAAATRYSFTDKDYYNNVVYYRLKITDRNSREKVLGNIISFQITEETKEISIYPITNLPGVVYLDLCKLNSEKIIVDVTDADEQKIVSKTLEKPNPSSAFEMRTVHLLIKGNYTITAFFDNIVLKNKLTVADPSMNVTENGSPREKLFTLK